MEALLGFITHNVPAFILVLSIIVFVHEFGHYWVARRCGVKIETFSIGFGPELFGWNDKSGTRWKFSLLPLGGYVKMFGDSDESSALPSAEVRSMSNDEKNLAFFYKSIGQRFAIVAAGPIMNYVFAVVVLAFLFAIHGQPFSPPEVGAVQEQSAAAEAGLQSHDKILSVDGDKIERFEDLQRIIGLNAGTPVVLSVERAGKILSVTVTPKIANITDRFGGEHKMARLGVSRQGLEFKHLDPASAVLASVEETVNISLGTLKAVGQMIAGTRSTDELGGPLRIAQMSGEVTHGGVAGFFWFLALLSINLGLLNLFPIPLLDGGHLAFYAAEKVRGRPLSDRAQEIGASLGLAFVISLMVFSTWNDLVQLHVVAFVKGIFS